MIANKNCGIETDDNSFRQFLNSVCHNCLIEHVSANLLPEVIAQIIIDHPYWHKDSFEILTESEVHLPDTVILDLLKPLFDRAEDEALLILMNQLFSKKLMIDSLIEYTDEYARMDIIENQNMWNDSCSRQINYN